MTPATSQTVEAFLSEDHRRLEDLLKRAQADGAAIDRAAYDEFRAGLLRHIAMEEKVLLPAAQRAGTGEPLAVAARLRLQHGAIAALLVPSPTQHIVSLLFGILAAHNDLEEGATGLYAECDSILAGDAPRVMERLRKVTEVRVAPYNDAPGVLESVARALERAGLHAEARQLLAPGGV